MIARNRYRRFRILRRFALLLTALLLFSGEGCGTDTHPVSLPVAPTAFASQPTGRSFGPPAPTRSSSPAALPGPTNFQLALPLVFSRADGFTADTLQNTTPIDAKTIEAAVSEEMKRLLFVVDGSNALKVYSPGVAPIAAQVVSHADKSVEIQFKQVVSSDAGSVTMLFDGVLLAGKVSVAYEQQYTPSILINAAESDVAVGFTTGVKWIAVDQIPAAPGNGVFRYRSDGGISLSWSAGQNAAAYNVYRQIADHDQQFQLLATVKGVTYSDSTSEAVQNVHSKKGITYVIFSVGPSGVENPGGVVISVSG